MKRKQEIRKEEMQEEEKQKVEKRKMERRQELQNKYGNVIISNRQMEVIRKEEEAIKKEEELQRMKEIEKRKRLKLKPPSRRFSVSFQYGDEILSNREWEAIKKEREEKQFILNS
jgi:hypothetical protein